MVEGYEAKVHDPAVSQDCAVCLFRQQLIIASVLHFVKHSGKKICTKIKRV